MYNSGETLPYCSAEGAGPEQQVLQRPGLPQRPRRRRRGHGAGRQRLQRRLAHSMMMVAPVTALADAHRSVYGGDRSSLVGVIIN